MRGRAIAADEDSALAAIPLTRIAAWHAALKGNIPCYQIGERTLGWGDLASRAAGRATALHRHGVRHDDLVALSLPNGTAFIELCFAIWQCGATPLPLSPRMPDSERRAVLELARPALHVADAPCPGSDVPTVTTDQTDATAHQGWREPKPSTCWKACTSGGSTGRPKIIVDHRPAAFDPGADFVGIPRDGVVLNTAPSCHNGPFSVISIALFKGCRVIDMARFDAEDVLRLIQVHAVQWVYLVPTMMHRIWHLGPGIRARYDLSSLRMAMHTAGPIPQWLKHAWIEWLGPSRIGEVYGATEGLARIVIGGEEWLARPGSVGKVTGGGSVKILDPGGNECANGVIGEVFLRPASGPGSTYHYIGATPRRTADGYESVGDLGHVDEAGYLYLADRRDDMIIHGGINVYPAEVEAALLRHPDITSAAVIGLADGEFGQRVHAIVQARGAVLESGELSRFLGEHLSPYKIPKSYEFTAEAVRDDAGKVRRSALRAAREGAG